MAIPFAWAGGRPDRGGATSIRLPMFVTLLSSILARFAANGALPTPTRARAPTQPPHAIGYRKPTIALHNAQQIRIIIVYTVPLRCPRVALPSNPVSRFSRFTWLYIRSVIMELLLSLLVGCGISLILFYRK
jgi:hypothetical protein